MIRRLQQEGSCADGQDPRCKLGRYSVCPESKAGTPRDEGPSGRPNYYLSRFQCKDRRDPSGWEQSNRSLRTHRNTEGPVPWHFSQVSEDIYPSTRYALFELL